MFFSWEAGSSFGLGQSMPDQVRVITLNDDEALINYAQPIVAELRANMVRVDSDFSAMPFKAKIANAERREIFPPPHVVGYGSSSAGAIPHSGTGAVSVRLHHGGPQGAKPKAEVVADIPAAIKERRA
jgi:threonyl-tRNA synthetase